MAHKLNLPRDEGSKGEVVEKKERWEVAIEMPKDENELIKNLLCPELCKCDSFKRVHDHINPSSREYYSYWREWHRPLLGPPAPPPAQPDIDILIVDIKLQLLGIEVKYMKPKLTEDMKRLKRAFFQRSFYEGIGEALALLRFGFTCVSLWHCFSIDAGASIIRSYREATRNLIDSLKLPINYKALKIIKRDGEPSLLDVTHISDLTKALHPNFRSLPYGALNPLQKDNEVKNNENFLRNALRIPFPS